MIRKKYTFPIGLSNHECDEDTDHNIMKMSENFPSILYKAPSFFTGHNGKGHLL